VKTLDQERDLERAADEFAEAWCEASNAPGRRAELTAQLRERTAADVNGGLAFLTRVAARLAVADFDAPTDSVTAHLFDLEAQLLVEWATDAQPTTSTQLGADRPVEAG